VRGLAALPRPAAPPGLAADIRDAILIERAALRQEPRLPLWQAVARWIEPRVMPYTVGALTSLLLFFSLGRALRPHVQLLREMAQAAVEQEEPFVPAPQNSDSPSLNPNGDLFRVMLDAQHGSDDDITIVANVFSNGSASLEEVMQAPRDRHVLADVQAALRRNPAFLPAARDRRPQTMRVVLSLSKVNVTDRSY
jgi:hypothetical protein